MTPDKLRLSNAAGRNRHNPDENDNRAGKQLLLTPEEAAVVIHGEIETIRDGNITHQAIQTNLADVICGGNSNDKILYARIPISSTKIRSGFSTERLERRRHSMRFFNNSSSSADGRRSSSLQRTGSVRHISADCKRDSTTTTMRNNEELVITKKNHSLLSRIFRRSVRMKRENSLSPIRKSTFCTQFPPAEWFNKGVTHLHSVGTQTSYTISDLDILPQRIIHSNDFDDDLSLILSRDLSQNHLSSAISTPRSLRRLSQSATLPRRHLSATKIPSNFEEKPSSISRISSQNSIIIPIQDLSVPSPPDLVSQSSSSSGNKTVINAKEISSRATKSLSSASSGYNSLPRSGKNSSRGSSRIGRSERKGVGEPNLSRPESSIIFHVSTGSNMTSPTGGLLEVNGKSPDDRNSTTMTTTINSNTNTNTKIFVQQQNSPTRSLITFENNNRSGMTSKKDNLIILNHPASEKENQNQKSIRPTSLYAKQNYFSNYNRPSTSGSETSRRTKYKNSYPDSIRPEKQKSSNFEDKEKKFVENNKIELNNNYSKNCPNNFLSDDKMDYKNLLKDQIIDDIESMKKKLQTDLDSDDFNNKNSCSKNFDFLERNCKNLVLEPDKIDKLISENDLDVSYNHHKKKSPGFPSLSDLSLHFTSLAAQNILKGVNNYNNSVDTLVEVNLAAEKNNAVNVRTDLGFV